MIQAEWLKRISVCIWKWLKVKSKLSMEHIFIIWQLVNTLIKYFQRQYLLFDKENCEWITTYWLQNSGGNEHKPKHEKFCLNVGFIYLFIYFTVSMVRQRKRLLREVMESQPVETFKIWLDMILSNMLCMTLLEQECWTKSLEVVSHLSHSCIMWYREIFM